jgi:hypothetical protein
MRIISLLSVLLFTQAALALPTWAAFPDFRAKDLDGAAVTARSHRGQTTLYLIGFTYEQRAEVETWTKALPNWLGQVKPVTPVRVVQMPVLSGPGVWARPFIESGLAKHTPKADRSNVMTSTDRDALVQGLELKDPDRAAVLALVDATGEVRLILRGGATDAKERELAKAMEALR